MILVEFSYEIMAAVLVVSFILVLAIEYLWLYIISKNHEEDYYRKSEINTNIHAMFESVLNSPTESAIAAETEALIKYLGDDFEKRDEAAIMILQLQGRLSDLPENKLSALGKIYDAVDPIKLYSEKLESGNNYMKGYACRQLADYGAVEKTEDIEQLLDSKNDDLAYNSAMALSELGDEAAVVKFAKICEGNRKYSHRVQLEMFQIYTGDRESLTRQIFENCGDYIKANCIKAYSEDCIGGLADIYLENIDSSNAQLKIAAVKALAQLGDEKYEHKLTVLLNDKNWIVRLAAVQGIEKIGGKNALDNLILAVRDEEWWVRRAAANAIVSIDTNLVYVEKVLSGYDKYAADAVKNALYKTVEINNGFSS